MDISDDLTTPPTLLQGYLDNNDTMMTSVSRKHNSRFAKRNEQPLSQSHMENINGKTVRGKLCGLVVCIKNYIH